MFSKLNNPIPPNSLSDNYASPVVQTAKDDTFCHTKLSDSVLTNYVFYSVLGHKARTLKALSEVPPPLSSQTDLYFTLGATIQTSNSFMFSYVIVSSIVRASLVSFSS